MEQLPSQPIDPTPPTPPPRMLPGASTPLVQAPLSAMTVGPQRQLNDLPKDELENLATEYGLDPTRYPTRAHLIAAIHARRQNIADLDREAMLDVLEWGRRSIPPHASKEQLAFEIARLSSMRFSGLSQRGLVVLARMRGIAVRGDEPVPILVRLLKRHEGLFAKINRKRRALIGSIVANMVGEDDGTGDQNFEPPQATSGQVIQPRTDAPSSAGQKRTATLKEDIEESGLFGGLANRVKKSADSYVNQKLDEIEARIDRKLDEIDRRLGEWRDKEVANRIRILKITLWASVIVGALSLIYSYITKHFGPDQASMKPKVSRVDLFSPSLQPRHESPALCKPIL